MPRFHGLLRILHFVGLAMFLGSVLGHIVLGTDPGAHDNPQALLHVRSAIAAATRALTLPGLGLLIVTGVWMTARRYGGFFRTRWLTMHQALALLIVLNALLILAPLGNRLLGIAREGEVHAASADLFYALARKEATFGAVNIVLTLLTIAVAVYRPRLGKTKQG